MSQRPNGANLFLACLLRQREYAFFPKTWVLPHDATDFCAQFDAEGQALAKGVTYIVKPENSSKVRCGNTLDVNMNFRPTACTTIRAQGRGIFLTKSLDKVAVGEPQVAQVYISRPLLLDGFKFDIRMYALVASCSPLRVYKVRKRESCQSLVSEWACPSWLVRCLPNQNSIPTASSGCAPPSTPAPAPATWATASCT